MRKLSTLAFAIGAIVSGQALAQAELKQVSASKAIPNQYIVVFKTPSVLNIQSADAVASYAEQASQTLVNKYNVDVSRKFAGSLNGVVVNASALQVQDLLSNPDIDYIEQDQIVSVSPLAATNVDQGNAIWGLDRVDQRSLPLNSNYHYDYDGAGVTAYVIDTGVLISHNEFGGRASHGYDFVDNDADATDCNGHGTHVAGTIGGSQYGVAKNVNIVGIKVLGCSGSGTNSGVIAGVDWVKNNASGPSVANMSLGGGVSQALDDAVNSAVAAGVTFVVAAGNDNSNACNYSPARAADAITVGSTTSSDSRSSFSNYGSCLDIYAPGSSIKSAWYNSNTSTNTISGTSMAAPHVAGVAALYLDEDSTRSPAQIDSLLSSRSSKNKVSDAKSGSPNELLYSLAGDGGPVDPVDPDPVLKDGVAVSISGATGTENFYTFEVPANTSAVTFNMSGGTGDADLYVQQGTKPTQSSYSCRPYKNGNEETCTFNNPAAGTWHVMVRGYSAYSGVSLVAQTSSGGGCGANCLDNGVPVTGLSGSRNSEVVYTIDVPAGVTLNVSTSGGSGDADLYVRKGAAPTTGTYDCRPYRNGNTESCSLSSGTGGTYYIMLRGYSAYSGLTLQASY